MVSALSFIIAIILTAVLAIILYPIAAMFWILGLFGKLSDGMFKMTKRLISSLWKDIGAQSNSDVPSESSDKV